MRPSAAGALLVAVSMGAPAQTGTFSELSGAQIKSVLSNKVVTDDQHWGHHYIPDGRVIRAEKGRVKPGRWAVENGQLCLTFPEISATKAGAFTSTGMATSCSTATSVATPSGRASCASAPKRVCLKA
jgi:hypothetical protein